MRFSANVIYYAGNVLNRWRFNIHVTPLCCSVDNILSELLLAGDGATFAWILLKRRLLYFRWHMAYIILAHVTRSVSLLWRHVACVCDMKSCCVCVWYGVMLSVCVCVWYDVMQCVWLWRHVVCVFDNDVRQCQGVRAMYRDCKTHVTCFICLGLWNVWPALSFVTDLWRRYSVDQPGFNSMVELSVLESKPSGLAPLPLPLVWKYHTYIKCSEEVK